MDCASNKVAFVEKWPLVEGRLYFISNFGFDISSKQNRNLSYSCPQLRNLNSSIDIRRTALSSPAL